jgi:hypothetical protein
MTTQASAFPSPMDATRRTAFHWYWYRDSGLAVISSPQLPPVLSCERMTAV